MSKYFAVIIFSILFLTSCNSSHSGAGTEGSVIASDVLFSPKADCGGSPCL